MNIGFYRYGLFHQCRDVSVSTGNE